MAIYDLKSYLLTPYLDYVTLRVNVFLFFLIVAHWIFD